MKNLLKLEELAQFLVCVFALYLMEVSWWAYLLLALGPDIGMLGYLVSPKVGAITYNLLHHKGFAVIVALLGVILGLISVHDPDSRGVDMVLYVSAVILYGHASMDRIFGYGLKFGDNFHHTHLGWIGKGSPLSRESSQS